MGFNLNTRIPSIQGTQTFTQTAGLPNPQNNIYIFGNRISPGSLTPPTSTPKPVIPNAGFPNYEYYNCYQLPTQYLNDALGMLSYFENCGFSVGYGIDGTIVLNNLNAVDITSLAASQQAILYYTASSN